MSEEREPTPEERVRVLVEEFGMDPAQAWQVVGIETGETEGDVVDLGAADEEGEA